MQKIRLQIMLSFDELNVLHRFQLETQCKNESQAVSRVFSAYNRLQFVISELEKRAHEAEEWKKRAEIKVGTPTKPITVPDASKNTDSKQKSVENINDSAKHNEAD